MITATSNTNAPNTTIKVSFLNVNAMLINDTISLSIQLFDENHRFISLPQPVRPMTPAEKTAFTSLTANAGETINQLVVRAAAPYISAVYGVTYAV